MTTKHQKLIKRFLAIGLGLVLVIVLKDQALAAFNINQNLNAVDSALINTWKVILSVSNIAVLLMLIIIGFSTIFKIQLDTYHIKKAIIPIIVGIILANFSLVICRTGLDLANILTVNLKNQIVAYEIGGTGDKEAQAIRRVFMPQQLLDAFKGEGVSVWIKAGGIAVGLGTLAAIGSAGGTGIILVVIIFGVLLLLPALAVWALAILFYSRTWMLFFLITLSPLAFLCVSWGPVQSFFKRWWNQFLLWTFMVPIAYVFFWLAVVIHRKIGDAGEFSLGSYTAGVVLLWLALVTPFKLGGAVGALLGGVMKKYGGIAAGWGKGAAWGAYNRAMEARFADKTPRSWLKKAIFPRMPSWRAMGAGWKRGRERGEQKSMAGPAATVEELAETYWLGAKKFQGKPNEKGQVPFGSRFNPKNWRGFSWAGQRYRMNAIQQAAQDHPFLNNEDDILQTGTLEEKAGRALSYAKNMGRVPEKMSELKQQMVQAWGEATANQVEGQIRGATKSIAEAATEEQAQQILGSRSVAEAFNPATNQKAFLDPGQIDRITQILRRIAAGTDEFSDLEEKDKQSAKEELSYYSSRPEDATDVIRSFALNNAKVKERLPAEDRADLAMPVGLGYAIKRAVPGIMPDLDVSGGQIFQAVKQMRESSDNPFPQDVQLKNASQAIKDYYDEQARLNPGLKGVQVTVEPSNSVFNFASRSDITEETRPIIQAFFQAANPGELQRFAGIPPREIDTAAVNQVVTNLKQNIAQGLDQITAGNKIAIEQALHNALSSQGKPLSDQQVKTILQQQGINVGQAGAEEAIRDIQLTLEQRWNTLNRTTSLIEEVEEIKDAVRNREE